MFWKTPTIPEMERELIEIEREISALRCRQIVLVNDLDKVNAPAGHGCRSMVDWLVSRLDMARATASDLAFAGRWMKRHRPVNVRLAEGRIGFDRSVATMRLARAGADDSTIEESDSMDLDGMAQLISRQRRVSRMEEHRVFDERFVAIQPTLDESSWRLAGRLPSIEGRIVERALNDRADKLRGLPNGDECTRGQRRADGLVAMAQDSLDREDDGGPTGNGSSVTVFVDVDRAAGTSGEVGSNIEYGPGIGPATLDRLLCTGTVQIVGLSHGKPVVVSDATRAIPPAIRRSVAHRDGGCVIAGCTSRYRLEPHHVHERARGGSHDPDNLATLCWFHHHVVAHGRGFRIDPDSPRLRRRLIRPNVGSDPP